MAACSTPNVKGDSGTAEKVQKYETFLNDRLKSDLKKALERRDAIYEEISEYTKLATMIETIKASKHAFEDGILRTKTDLGCNFFCEAEVEDPRMICLGVGYGIYVQLTLDEALEFIKKKTPLLEM
eukprot:m.1532818 g.1532818  ORF g.1532818 m.1532818 type:complete len:126 (+) comp25241_c0_seq28:450-827(+)